MDPRNHARLMGVLRRVERDYSRRNIGFVQPLEHQIYLRVLSVVGPPLNIHTVKPHDYLGDCSICQETFKLGEEYALLPCNPTHPHSFHKECIKPWLRGHDTCPTCRGKV